MSYQKITIIGNVGNDFQQKSINNKFVLNGSIAVTKTWLDQNNEKQSNTTWFAVSQWSNNDRTNFLKHLVKGTQILVTGEVSARTFVNKQNITESQLSVTADDIKLISQAKQNTQTQNNNEEKTPF